MYKAIPSLVRYGVYAPLILRYTCFIHTKINEYSTIKVHRSLIMSDILHSPLYGTTVSGRDMLKPNCLVTPMRLVSVTVNKVANMYII